MLSSLRPAFVTMLAFTALTGAALPLAIVGGAQILAPEKADGSLVIRDGQPVGSLLIGQNFTGAGFFHPRPSATVEPDPKDSSKTIPTPYAADNSAASNLAPTSKALIDRVRGDVAALHATSVPADAVTTSGSGLDPDISPENALMQADRVAAARHLATDQVRALIASHTQLPLLGFLGGARVNVLALNLALLNMPR
ncbi:potassium-transporting ATPase subunit KdpC [Acetobacteraceae bacterium KSS8]|uniref:Potassium-transporting ATPase KdpC subunit n=1 Tax=Endosaccharibacter trunci TaxID=2812733 RepID=A0ABT1W7G5_9PROT|nr:potassium-transporting ATPase subunit KdpC [Acetobacteraceae bacterium KSS8]